jgi:hypothetical protein
MFPEAPQEKRQVVPIVARLESFDFGNDAALRDLAITRANAARAQECLMTH